MKDCIAEKAQDNPNTEDDSFFDTWNLVLGIHPCSMLGRKDTKTKG